MIPLMPTVALALFSLLCSAFVILRVLLSALPHHRRPLGRSLYSLTSGRPSSSSSLPTADKSHVWLALCDVYAVAVFLWEAFSQWSESSSSASTASNSSAGSAARLWLALTFRQTCLLIISALILAHVRRRKSVSLGYAHWFLWVPLLSFAGVSTVAAGLFAGAVPGRRFLVGYIVYSSTTAILNTIIFGSLVGSLVIVKRSLANFDQAKKESNDPPGETTTAEKPRIAFATEDIDAIREGSLWITSTTSSRRRGEPSSSYTPHSTASNRTRMTQNIPPEQNNPPRFPFPFLPPQGAHSSTSSRNPSPRRGDAHANDFGYAPFRSRTQSLRAAAAAAAALTLSSQGSWISSSLGTHPTLSAWSYPTQRSNPPNRAQSAADDTAIAVAGERYAPSPVQAERGTAASPASTARSRSQEIEISTLRILAWLAGVWTPLVLSLPYLTRFNSSNSQSNESTFTSTFLVLSATISSPLLVLNLLLRHPISIPYDMFDAPPVPPRSVLRYAPSMMNSSASTFAGGYYYRRRGSGARLVTGRRPTSDVKGAVDEKGYCTAPALPVGDDEKGRPSPSRNWRQAQGAASGPVHWHLPSRPAPTRLDSRRHSSIHPTHDLNITPPSGQQRTAHINNGHVRVIRPTKSLPFRRS